MKEFKWTRLFVRNVWKKLIKVLNFFHKLILSSYNLQTIFEVNLSSIDRYYILTYLSIKKLYGTRDGISKKRMLPYELKWNKFIKKKKKNWFINLVQFWVSVNYLIYTYIL